jgi:hypothetical protein
LRPSAQPDDALVALVYETSHGFVVSYVGSALANHTLPGLYAAIAEARAELLHYTNRRGENKPAGITRRAFRCGSPKGTMKRLWGYLSSEADV